MYPFKFTTEVSVVPDVLPKKQKQAKAKLWRNRRVAPPSGGCPTTQPKGEAIKRATSGI